MTHPEYELMLARQEIDRRVREAALHRSLREMRMPAVKWNEPVRGFPADLWRVLKGVLRAGYRDRGSEAPGSCTPAVWQIGK